MKTRASIKNAAASLVYYLSTILAGLLVRKAVIAFLGIEYQGIDGLFGNVISMLSIAELGIGTAIISHLYEPLSKGDRISVSSLMVFYRRCYFGVAALVLILGLLLIPVLPWMILDYQLPYSLTCIYLCFLADAVASYLLASRRSLLMADQKGYIVSVFDTVFVLVSKTLQVLVLWRTENYLIFLGVMVFCRVLENLMIYQFSRRNYPYMVEGTAQMPEDVTLTAIRQKVKGAVFHKIGGFVVLGTDSILISKFLGLAVSGMYSNYWVIISAVQNICSRSVSAATASVGHLLAEKNHEKNYRVFRELQLINFLISNTAAVGVFCVCSSLVSLLFGEVYCLDELTVLMLSLVLYFYCMRSVYAAFKEAAGILYEDRFIPIIESVVNIVASLLFLKYYGLAGIFMGTIVSSLLLYFYTYPVLVYGGLLGRKYTEYLLDFFWQIAVLIVSLVLGQYFCGLCTAGTGVIRILLLSLIAGITALLAGILGYGIWKKEWRGLLDRLPRQKNK